MIRIEHFPDQKKEPLFPEAACVNSFLVPEGNPKPLLYIFTSTADYFAHCLQAILYKAVPANVENEELVDIFPTHNTVEESISCLALHLAPGVVLQNLDLGPDAQEERILAERELASPSFPSLEISHQIGIIEHRVVKVACRQRIIMPITAAMLFGGEAVALDQLILMLGSCIVCGK